MSDQENQASRFARDMAANAEKMFKATQLIANTRDEDVSIGMTPKQLVMRHDKVTLLGICEGGVFTTCYAALHPEKVKNLVITITPIDFHADVKDKAAHHGFLNVWTRSLDPEDIDNLVDTYGVLPGEFMSSV